MKGAEIILMKKSDYVFCLLTIIRMILKQQGLTCILNCWKEIRIAFFMMHR